MPAAGVAAAAAFVLLVLGSGTAIRLGSLLLPTTAAGTAGKSAGGNKLAFASPSPQAGQLEEKEECGTKRRGMNAEEKRREEERSDKRRGEKEGTP